MILKDNNDTRHNRDTIETQREKQNNRDTVTLTTALHPPEKQHRNNIQKEQQRQQRHTERTKGYLKIK